jgi:hypothetical protein
MYGREKTVFQLFTEGPMKLGKSSVRFDVSERKRTHRSCDRKRVKAFSHTVLYGKVRIVSEVRLRYGLVLI